MTSPTSSGRSLRTCISVSRIDAAALLAYRAAWVKDLGAARISRESSMAKAFATEKAQGVIDRAVQIFGGHGVRVGTKVEALYREIRAPRIYEGATEVQKIIVARELMKMRESARRHADHEPGRASGGKHA